MQQINTELYLESISRLPKEGQHIIGFQQDKQIVVYQAYNHQIADYAIQHQTFGGNYYSYDRMSWIKPNFLWMMYRCGWASKENQERVLAIWIDQADFETILQQAVYSSFDRVRYQNREQWKQELAEKEVRLQWDPDHDPFGEKLTRRAIQIGMKESILQTFGKQFIRRIEDVTDFVREQKALLDAGQLQELLVPVETVYQVSDDLLKKHLGVDLV